MRHTIITVCLVFILPSLVSAQERPLLAAALAQVGAVQSEPERVRSMTRTWWGVAMIAGGTAMTVSQIGTECAESDLIADIVGVPTCDDVGDVAGLGIVMAVSGALLATIWSDVPVVRNMMVSAAPGRVQVGRTLKW